jgi:hypothetical protein
VIGSCGENLPPAVDKVHRVDEVPGFSFPAHVVEVLPSLFQKNKEKSEVSA